MASEKIERSMTTSGHKSEALHAGLAEAFARRRCVQAWLGYGKVLFLGFGENVLPPTPPQARHPLPTYEVQTNFANWCVVKSSEVLAKSTDALESAESALLPLVGCLVTDWRLNSGTGALTISFEGGLEVVIEPYTDQDMAAKEAWGLKMSDDIYYAVSCSATVFTLNYRTSVASPLPNGE